MYSLGEGVSRDYVKSASGTALPQTKVKHWVNSNSGECILWAAVLLNSGGSRPPIPGWSRPPVTG